MRIALTLAMRTGSPAIVYNLAGKDNYAIASIISLLYINFTDVYSVQHCAFTISYRRRYAQVSIGPASELGRARAALRCRLSSLCL
jgi:hypothetical protein